MNKNIIGFIVCIAMCLVVMLSCEVDGSYELFDTKWNFNYVMIRMPDDTVIEGEPTSWKDFEDGDQLQVTINGKTYLTHSSNIVLIKN